MSDNPSLVLPWRMALPHTAAAVPMARALVRAALANLERDDDADTAELLTAELVANAVEHTPGTAPILLVVALLPTGCCHVEVHDADPDPPPALTRPGPATMPDPWQEDGRGLLLIRTLSEECGHRPGYGGGKAVWFTLPEPFAPRGGENRPRRPRPTSTPEPAPGIPVPELPERPAAANPLPAEPGAPGLPGVPGPAGPRLTRQRRHV